MRQTFGVLCAIALALFVLRFLTGCTGSLNEARRQGIAERRGLALEQVGYSPSERCQALDDQHRWSGAVGKTTAVLGTGLAGVAASEAVDDRRLQRGLIIGAGVSAAIAAGAILLSESSAASHAGECAP